jgi:hypothetical protein
MVVRTNPDGSFVPGVTNLAITPAMKPITIVQRMLIACLLHVERVHFISSGAAA